MSISEQEFLYAHEMRDYPRLVGYYQKIAAEQNSVDAACFYMSFAYVFALETNHEALAEIHSFLKKHGREE